MSRRSLLEVLDGQRFVRSAWRQGLRPWSPAAICFTLVCVAIAAAVRFALGLFSPEATPFALFYAATLIVTLVAGPWLGAFAALLGAALSIALKSLGVPIDFSGTDVASLLLYSAASAIIIFGAEQYRRLVRKLDQEEHYRAILVDELGHRLQNKLATIHAILGHELRDHREMWQRVSGRLHALSSTDELIIRPHAKGIEIGTVVEKELAPYDPRRATIEGPPLEVPPKLAVTLALVFHELATNAAKYGALSSSDGRVLVSWKFAGGGAVIRWQETGGPPVLPPTRRGFGRRIIEEGLTPFGGKVECSYESTGAACTIVVPTAA
jgi:two-component sensor histidine kinase